MATDPDRERRVREARVLVQQSPDDVAARLELGAALFDAHDPANVQALQGAAQSAVAAGDVARASGYLRLLAALSGVPIDTGPAGDPASRGRSSSSVLASLARCCSRRSVWRWSSSAGAATR